MKIISLFLCLRIIQGQLQLNVIQGQPFYYNLEKEFNTDGYDLRIMWPDLGLSIQGGFTQGPLNTNINVNQIVSTSLLEEFNLISFLKQIAPLYYIELVQYDYQGVIGTPLTLFSITSTDQTCQDIEILDNLIILVHCINITNNQILIYNYNNSIITSQNMNINLTNSNSVISVDIQQYYNKQQYELYFVYNTKFSSFIYNTTLQNNSYSVPQLVWTYNASFMQIFISNDQEVFALQFNYLLFQYQGLQQNYSSQNNSNWIAMTIQFDYQDDFLIYLVNNYTITELFFLDQFYLIDEQFLPIQINSAQMLGTYENIYVLTPSYALVYGFQDGEYLIFSQFLGINLMNSNNLISSQQHLIISFADSAVQLYQLLDYVLIAQNPQNSGNLVLNYYNIKGSLEFNQSLYVNLLSSYQNQIMPTVYGLYQMTYSPENPYFINFNVGQYFVGSNISYYINSTNLSGTSFFSKNIESNSENPYCDNALVSSLNKFNSYIVVCGKGQDINVGLYQYLQFTSSIIWASQVTTQFYPNKFAFIGLSNEGDIFLAFSFQTIYVYYVYIGIQIESLYQIDLADILNVTAFIVQDYVVIDNNIFIQLNQSYVILGIYQTYFEVIEIGNQTYSQVSGNSYNQNYIYATNADSLDIFVWYEDGLSLYQSQSYQSINDQIDQIFVYPLTDGLFLLLVYNNQTTQLSFYDKSIMNSVNLGQTLSIPVDTTNFTLNYSSTAYSGVYFYIHAIQNNTNYINIYQINQQQIGALKQSKWFSTIPQNITVCTDIVTQIDYMSVYFGDGYTVFPISHNNYLFQFPNFQMNPSYEYNNDIVLNNSYSQALVQLTININQLFVYVENNYLNTTLNGNLSNGSIIVNPYDYFSGAIQGYNISCNNCNSIEYQPIISNQYLYSNASTLYSLYYQQNDSFFVYLSNLQWINYTQVSANIDLTTQPLNLTPIVYYQDSEIFIGIFLEVNTNAITWLLLNDTTYYICTILPNTNQTVNITLPGLEYSLSQYILYNKGYLQIYQPKFYSCYYYQIVNSAQLLTTIVSPVSTQFSYEEDVITFINIETTSNYSMFGSLSQTGTRTIFSFILNVTQVGNNSFVLNYFNIQYLQQFDSLLQLFPIQSIQQFGNVIQENGIYVIMFAYTTEVNSGIIQLEIKDYQVLNLQEKCSLQLLNQKTDALTNMMNLNQNQIAILQLSDEKDVGSIILSFYYVDYNNCNYEQIIQPYTYQVFDNQRQAQSINYLNQNNLLLSLNGYTQIYEINNFINLEFNSSQNSSIEITAYNNLYNQSQLINIYYTETQQVIINQTHSFAWYWILLIVLVCLIIIIMIIWFFFNRNKGHEAGQYQAYNENEIEIKTDKKNENLSYH